MWDVITHSCLSFNGGLTLTAVEARAWVINHIQLFYMNVITYSCSNLDVILANLC